MNDNAKNWIREALDDMDRSAIWLYDTVEDDDIDDGDEAIESIESIINQLEGLRDRIEQKIAGAASAEGIA